MTTQPPFKTEFTIDKAYFEECFDQTANQTTEPKMFTKAAIFGVVGLALITVIGSNASAENREMVYYLGYFAIGLAVLELLSIKFKRTWWLWRQQMSKAANNKVTVTIDETGIHSQSQYVNQMVNWQDVYRLHESEVGFTLQLKQTQSYLSKRGLSEAACDFIRQKLK
ncbi:YcxB family protein [Shewanella maritima]|uniref:YcxB family protein n=1 Tax=Shewanella maritima TaxID=2520507 RepID=UPI0037365C51